MRSWKFTGYPDLAAGCWWWLMKNRLKLARTVTGCQETEAPISMSCIGDAATTDARFDSVASATSYVNLEGRLVSEILWGWCFGRSDERTVAYSPIPLSVRHLFQHASRDPPHLLIKFRIVDVLPPITLSPAHLSRYYRSHSKLPCVGNRADKPINQHLNCGRAGTQYPRTMLFNIFNCQGSTRG
jgi:hypothetical protein